MFLVIWRVAGRGEVYDDDVVLVTSDLVKAVNKAMAYAPFGWTNPYGWTHHADRTSVFRCVPERDGASDLVYARWTKKHGHRRGHTMRWLEAWGLPMWKKAYDRHVREADREAMRKFREFAAIIRERNGFEREVRSAVAMVGRIVCEQRRNVAEAAK